MLDVTGQVWNLRRSQMTYDPAALDPIGNIDSEQTFSSGKEFFLKENEDYCSFRKVTGWTGPEDDCQ